MKTFPTLDDLKKVTKPAHSHVPAIGYCYAESDKENPKTVASTSLAFGKKHANDSPESGDVGVNTQFPASSLSKIVFTYLVLQLAYLKKFDLTKPLIEMLPNEKLLDKNDKYPDKAMKLTAEHVLSHTTGLPNLGSKVSEKLTFDEKTALGTGYSYSGEAFLYLQAVIESELGEPLESLAKEHVFKKVGMNNTTFLPPSESNEDIVSVHTELKQPKPIYIGPYPVSAAGSLLTTADDFAKFITAWLERMDTKVFRDAFIPKQTNAICGLGWHLYKDKKDIIAYQYGENPNTRAFVAINVTKRKGAAFFTNSENGMSIANRVFNSPDLAPVANLQVVYHERRYHQCDKAGWSMTLDGKIAEARGDKTEDVRQFYHGDRLEWFDAATKAKKEKPEFNTPLSSFAGTFTNRFNDEIKLSIDGDHLIHKVFNDETKLTRITETEFVPEKHQDFKLLIQEDNLSKFTVDGDEYNLERTINNEKTQCSELEVESNDCQHPPKL